MSPPNLAGTRFRIERLEDRVVPGCLPSQTSFFEEVLAAWATFRGNEARNPGQLVSSRMAALRESLTASDAVQNSESPAVEATRLPAWAETFLAEVAEQLVKTETGKAGAVSGSHEGQSARLGELIAKVDQALAAAETSHANAIPRGLDTMPAWAEDLLLQIRDETSQRLQAAK